MRKKRVQYDADRFVRVRFTQDRDVVMAYLTDVANALPVDGFMFEEVEGAITFYPQHDDGLWYMADRILEDYSTLGFTVDVENLDIYDFSVYISDPEINTYFIHQRLNMSRAEGEAFGELTLVASRELHKLQKLVNQIDSLNVLNGTYKMKKIIIAMGEAMAAKGIFVGDEINAILNETIH